MTDAKKSRPVIGCLRIGNHAAQQQEDFKTTRENKWSDHKMILGRSQQFDLSS
jgi:hypothetical protein